jgi:glycosyltransferase involved in cell wall biosynthesis
MRILHLVHQYPPDDLGGTELYTQQLATAQTARGHDVGVFFRRMADGRGVESWREPAGPRVWAARSGVPAPHQRLRAAFGEAPLAQAWAAVVAAFQPDLVHVQHLLGLPTDCVTLLQTRGIPYVVTAHDYWWGCPNAQLLTNYDSTICAGPRLWVNCGRCALARSGLPSATPLGVAAAAPFALRQRRLTPILDRAGALIAPTRFVRDTYRALGLPVTRAVVIPHGIRLPALLPARQRPDPPPLPLRVAYIGGIAPQKGVHVLIEAVNRLPDGAVELVVYGNLEGQPAYVRELRALLARPDDVLAGPLPHADLWETLAGLDLVAVPTLWYETASLIVQEAFAAGVPVLGSRIGALTERVRDGVDGLLAPAGEVAAWSETLQRLSEAPAKLAQLRAGIQPVVSLEQHVDAILELYRSLLQETAG